MRRGVVRSLQMSSPVFRGEHVILLIDMKSLLCICDELGRSCVPKLRIPPRRTDTNNVNNSAMMLAPADPPVISRFNYEQGIVINS